MKVTLGVFAGIFNGEGKLLLRRRIKESIEIPFLMRVISLSNDEASILKQYRDINYYLSGSKIYGSLTKLHINDILPFKDKIQRSIIVPREVEKIP